MTRTAYNGKFQDIENGELQVSMAVIRTFEAEKRTHFAELRTGIGVLTIPLSLLTILIATSDYYSVQDVLGFILGLITGIAVLAAIGMYLVVDSLQRLRRKRRLLRDLGLSSEDIGRIVREHLEQHRCSNHGQEIQTDKAGTLSP